MTREYDLILIIGWSVYNGREIADDGIKGGEKASMDLRAQNSGGDSMIVMMIMRG